MIDGMYASEANFHARMCERGKKLEYVGRRGARFDLDGLCYKPDFRDPESGDFYEVCGSKQALKDRKHVIKLFRRHHPDLRLFGVWPDGSNA